MEKKKVIQILLIVCLVLTLVFGGCARSETLPAPNQPKEPASEPTPEEIIPEPIKPILDSDDDGFSDWFEENVAHLDPLTPNDRYLLYVDTDGSISDDPIFRKILERFIQRNKFLPENVLLLEREGATFERFMEAVERIASKSDENDLVYISLNTHGISPDWRNAIEVIGHDEEKGEQIKFTYHPLQLEIEPTLSFNGKSISYRELGQILNDIKCKNMLVTYSSCAGNTAVETLAENTKYPRVVIGPLSHPYTLIATLGGLVLNLNLDPEGRVFMNNSLYEELKDSYLSVELLCQYNPGSYPKEIIEETIVKINESVEKGRTLWTVVDLPVKVITTVKMADPSNIASDFYFGETKVKDFYWPAKLLKEIGIEDLPRYRNYPAIWNP